MTTTTAEAKGTEATTQEAAEATAEATTAKAKAAPMSQEALEGRLPDWAQAKARKAAPKLVAIEVKVQEARATGMLGVYHVLAALYKATAEAEAKAKGPEGETAEAAAERCAKVARGTVALAEHYARGDLAKAHKLAPTTVPHVRRVYFKAHKVADAEAAEGSQARQVADTLANLADGKEGPLGVMALQDAVRDLGAPAEGKGGRKAKSPDDRVLDIMAKVAKGLKFEGADYGAFEFTTRMVGQLTGGKVDKAVVAMFTDMAAELVRLGVVELES
jgi:hypothetical protein